MNGIPSEIGAINPHIIGRATPNTPTERVLTEAEFDAISIPENRWVETYSDSPGRQERAQRSRQTPIPMDMKTRKREAKMRRRELMGFQKP